MRLLILLLSALLPCTAIISCSGQMAGDGLSSYWVTIYNSQSELNPTPSDKKIFIGRGNRLDTIIIKANKTWFSPTYPFDPVICKIQTQQYTASYKLRLDRAYLIYWDEKGKYWGLKKTKKKTQQ